MYGNYARYILGAENAINFGINIKSPKYSWTLTVMLWVVITNIATA